MRCLDGVLQRRAWHPDFRKPDHEARVADGKAVHKCQLHSCRAWPVLLALFALLKAEMPVLTGVLKRCTWSCRQLASMQQQLERTKLELRSSQSNGMWGAD